jgi:hypothetical protein
MYWTPLPLPELLSVKLVALVPLGASADGRLSCWVKAGVVQTTRAANVVISCVFVAILHFGITTEGFERPEAAYSPIRTNPDTRLPLVCLHANWQLMIEICSSGEVQSLVGLICSVALAAVGCNREPVYSFSTNARLRIR